MASVLSREADIAVVDQTVTVKEALSAASSGRYNLVLAGATLPDRGAIKVIEALATMDSPPKVMVVGVPATKEVILKYIMAGAAGYVQQDVLAEELLVNIRAVGKNEALVSPEIAAALIAQARQLTRQLRQQEVRLYTYEQLTTREQGVMMLIGAGCTNQEIGRQLSITEGTVKNHVHHILQKLGVKDRQSAAAFWRLFHQPPGIGRPETAEGGPLNQKKVGWM